jgi:hypothetical protein
MVAKKTRRNKAEAKPEQHKTQIIFRPHPPIEVCASCGAIQSFVQTRGMKQTAGTLLVAPAHCKNCGQLASIRMTRR